MKNTISILVLILFWQVVVAQPADAEFQRITKEYTLHVDGSIDFHYYKEIKLLSHYAFHRLYGETFIIYNPKYEKLKINLAYTHMADGKKVITPENAFNEVLPRFCTNAPAFNQLREMVVTHTGLEVGSTIYLDYIVHSEKGYYPDLMIDELLLESSPAKELAIRVNVPAGTKLNFQLLNSEGKPERSTNNGVDSYTWTFTNLPASSKDYYQASQHTDRPRLLCSTAESLNSAWQKLTAINAFDVQTNCCMSEQVDEIVGNNPDPLSTVLAIQKFLTNNMNTVHIPMMYTGYTCRSPVETFESNLGTPLEKALLFVSLLKSANIESQVVVAIPNSLFTLKTGVLSTSSQFLVQVNLDNYGVLYLSPDKVNQQNMIYSLADCQLLALNPKSEIIQVSQTDIPVNQIKANGKFIVDENDQLSANIQLNLQANANPYMSLFSDPSAIKKIWSGGIGANDITAYKSVELSQEKSRSFFEIEKEGAFEVQHNYLEFQLPYTSNGVDSWHINLLTAERSSALEIPESIHEKYTYSFEIPAHLKVVSPAKNIEINNEAGYLKISYETVGNKLEVIREIKLEKKITELEIYSGFKEIMDAWNNVNFRNIILKK